MRQLSAVGILYLYRLSNWSGNIGFKPPSRVVGSPIRTSMRKIAAMTSITATPEMITANRSFASREVGGSL